jgi:RimJ/RimL family protein N-acetyltransferase
VIETPRLILRPPTLADIDDIQAAKEAMWHDLQMWMSWAYDDNKHRGAIQDFVQGEHSAPGSLILCGFERGTGDFVVSTGLDAIPEKPGHYSTGYWVHKPYQGKGLATESTNAVLRYAFGRKKATSVSICYYEGNEPSRRVIEKLGFRADGIRPKGHKRCLDGMPLDIHDYVMTDAGTLPPMDVTFG